MLVGRATPPSPGNAAGVTTDHRKTEALLEASSLEWIFLRNALCIDLMVVAQAQAALATGTFHHNQGDGTSAYVSRDDCAAVAAAWLAGGSEHAGRAYDVTGPELLGAEALAALFSEVGGKPVAAQHLDDDALADGLRGAGLPPETAELTMSFGAAIRTGFLDQRSSTVHGLTGRPAQTVSEVLAAAL